MSNKIAFYIEGGIGAGKSTLCNMIADKLKEYNFHVEVIPEPVDEWEKTGILKEFYEDMSGKSYEFQTITFITRIMAALNVMKARAINGDDIPEIYIIERSIFSDRFFFAEGLHDAGLMSTEKYNLYLKWWHLWENVCPFDNFEFIYLRTDLDNCMNRIETRGRSGESVSKDYQKSLIARHDAMFPDDTGFTNIAGCNGQKYIRIDSNVDFRIPGDEQTKFFDKIVNHICSSVKSSTNSYNIMDPTM